MTAADLMFNYSTAIIWVRVGVTFCLFFSFVLTLFFKLCQPTQDEHKEAEIKKEPEAVEEVKEEGTENKEEAAAEQEKEDKGEEKVKEEEEKKKEEPAKEKKAEKKAEEAKGSKRQKTIQCKVTLLDDTQFECELDVRHLHSDST